jgi:FtsP/CotA-like multicopper oxidase with cupredoxin domain
LIPQDWYKLTCRLKPHIRIPAKIIADLFADSRRCVLKNLLEQYKMEICSVHVGLHASQIKPRMMWMCGLAQSIDKGQSAVIVSKVSVIGLMNENVGMCMNKSNCRATWLILVSVFLSAVLPLPVIGQTSIIDPPQFQWTYHPASANNPEAYYSGVMEFGLETFEIGGETFTTRAYRQAGTNYSIPGPTMTMMPGNKYVLRFHNTLPYQPKVHHHNIYKDPNVANVHTHGLHVSGESPGDDVSRSFEGSFGGDFVYDVPADHMGGTYWYHAHHHGSTYLQVASGAFGMLVVDDSNDGIPANVAAMSEKQIVLGFVDPNVAGIGGDTLISGTLSPTWTVNGVVGGDIAAQLGTWQHWRVLVADRNAKTKAVEFGPDCDVVLLARDGVWRTSAPTIVSGNSMRLTGASRADFAIRVWANSHIKIDGQVVASITPEGKVDSTVHPYDVDGVSMWSALRPDYLRDLRNVKNVSMDSVTMGMTDINGQSFDPLVPTFTKLADSVQQWSLVNAKNHPFHMHIYHVQALEDSVEGYEAGEYYDVIAENMNIRFDLSSATGSPFAGRTVMHCHILAHEDLGAMGWMDVIGGTPPPTYPLDGDIPEPYSEYYSLYVIGDANDDGVFTNTDIPAFVLALLEPSTYAAMYPDVDPDIRLDMNGNGLFSNGDIAKFVEALLGGP